MTKYLTLLRHGEAEHGYGQSGDFKRKLTRDGKYKLQRLANVLKERKVEFDLLLKSPATRTVETAGIIRDAVLPHEDTEEGVLYLAETDDIIKVLNKLSDDIHKVMVVGHNPGISALLSFLTNEYQISLSPGMMAVIELHADKWGVGLSRGMGTLQEILQ
ncbi:phosphohistidine phosphatase SixA [Echinicola sp. 20G]|uniref:phosphohistidine phosphatase SixA n=1 Tax=Echinicola sp. 20G TaxID=2781961 RepID=UPI00191061EB|nr:phosphohistidine phosphatase SixA [Echinicola sp. 20G]